MNISTSTEQTIADATAYILGNDFDISELPQAIQPLAQHAIEEDKFKGKENSLRAYPALGLNNSKWIFFAGAGSKDIDGYRRAAGEIGHQAREKGLSSVSVISDGDPNVLITAIGTGNYRFDCNSNEKSRKQPLTDLYLSNLTEDDNIDRATGILNGRTLARDLINMPPADLYPDTLAQEALKLVGDQITVEVWDEKKLKEEGMGGIIAVGQGSTNPPRFIHLHYTPKGTRSKTVAIIGKGVTFDAGGLSLKTSAGMQTMRCDMAGSGTVLGIFKALAQVKPNVEVHGLIGAAENMCSAGAYKLGDVLRMRNGKTVEIHNTDAEGRLVMADCLAYGSELKVDEMIDIATLTGACMVALGRWYSGLFSNEEDMVKALLGSADNAGEGLWRLPLPDFYKAQLKTEWADVKNVGGRMGGAITAALFLSNFVDGPKWAHIDIAGPAFNDKRYGHLTSGATGTMVETLIDWLDS
ncbi:MAG: leucyl aminopeptidase [Proteobacteria bacterium]|nr:leucyl aminopeptidase [Pseudomonadota bacterium]